MRVYLLGNPVTYWFNLAMLVIYCGLYFAKAFAHQRNIRLPGQISDLAAVYIDGALWVVMGWALHYFPFIPMARVLYFHHYMPAFLYSCVLAGIVVDITVSDVFLVRHWRHLPP